MKQRNGSTLIELVLSMSAGSAVMLLAISLMHQTMMLTERSGHRSDSSCTLDQLAQNFRRDVHLATELKIDAEGKLNLIGANDSQINYIVQNNSVIRLRKHTSDENEQERYQLSEDASAIFQVKQEPDRATRTVRGETGLTEPMPRVDLHVEAYPTAQIRPLFIDRSLERCPNEKNDFEISLRHGTDLRFSLSRRCDYLGHDDHTVFPAWTAGGSKTQLSKSD